MDKCIFIKVTPKWGKEIPLTYALLSFYITADAAHGGRVLLLILAEHYKAITIASVIEWFKEIWSFDNKPWEIFVLLKLL